MDVFKYRDDNFKRSLRNLEYSSQDLDNTFPDVNFNFKFSINKVSFNSRLNEDLYHKLKRRGSTDDILEVLERDYVTSKRQFVFYIIDCCEGSALNGECSTIDHIKLKREIE